MSEKAEKSVCSVEKCGNEGLITQRGTGKRFCIKHAWKSERPQDHACWYIQQNSWTN